MKVVAVVVTYNRLNFLKKCLAAIRVQTSAPDSIIVVNNGSTDGTGEWLQSQDVIACNLNNVGGAGGFSYGIATAYKQKADWIWLMDDDSIAQPDALQQLLSALTKLKQHQQKVGFLSSSVLWTDGGVHEMNRTYLLEDKNTLAGFSFAKETDLPLIQFGTFVSMLLSANAVKKVGLPIKEFFIWGDDVEYSKRLINSGLAGFAVEDSIVTHETPANHESNVFTDPRSSIWKFNYGLRNELFIKRSHQGEQKFWISWLHRMLIMPFRIILNRKTDRWSFIKVVWKTSLSAIGFQPSIENV